MNSRPPIAGKRRRVGHLYDGIVTINAIECGVVEHGRQYIGENSRKWSTDTLKVVKVLHDMLYSLQSHVDSLAALREMQVMGIVTAGECGLCRSIADLLTSGVRMALPILAYVIRPRSYLCSIGR